MASHLKLYLPGDSGIVSINKPWGWTSHDVVAKLRKIYGTKKIGHAGTLDPAATGILLIGVNRATKMLGYLIGLDKTYQTQIRLGYATLTDDGQGEILATSAPEAMAAITEADITREREGFLGEIYQKPSHVSAIKVAGKRSYERVRAGEEVELAPRKIHISAFTIESIHPHDGVIDITATISCSSGTYIRAIARDLGQALGVHGHVLTLERLRIGSFTHTHELGEIDGSPLLDRSIEELALGIFTHRILSAQEIIDIKQGKKITAAGISGTYVGTDDAGEAIVLLHDVENSARSEFFLAPI